MNTTFPTLFGNSSIMDYYGQNVSNNNYYYLQKKIYEVRVKTLRTILEKISKKLKTFNLPKPYCRHLSRVWLMVFPTRILT